MQLKKDLEKNQVRILRIIIILLSTGRLVLACDWKESGTKLDCYVKEGFSFSYSVTDHLTLEILNATEEVAGQYFMFPCSFGPQNGDDVHPHSQW